MGFFKKILNKEEKKPQTQSFVSEILSTSNVSKTLQDVAKKYNLRVSSLDFDILDIETLVKFDEESDFAPLGIEELESLKSGEALLDPKLEIIQNYEIRVKRYEFNDNFEILGKMKVDKLLTHATYFVSPDSKLKYSNALEKLVIEEMNKKKIKSGILADIDLFQSNFEEDIKNLIAKIRVLGGIEEAVPIELCKGIPPIKPIKLQVIEHYKRNEKKDDRIKDLIYPIKKGEVIIEIVKPKEGKNGRNCRGEIIEVAKITDTEIPEYKIDIDTRRKEDDDKIEYIADKNGYVYIKENVIMIRDELEVNQISLRTGNIKGAEDSDVKLEVKESGVLKEAIKDGMVVETTELIVKGNVGNGAKIKAKKLEIDGQTHKKSQMVAQKAKLNAHKGHLKANTAVIQRLEGGIVEANEVHIEQAISGKVIAKTISVGILGSHVTLISSDLIQIENLKGSENKFIIDEAKVSHKEMFINDLEEEYRELEIKLNKLKDKLLSNKKIIAKNKPSIEQVKFKIQELKEKGIPVNPAFIDKLKKFNAFVAKTKEIEHSIKEALKKQKKIKNKLARLQKGVFSARIISHSGFTEYNRIEFHLTEPPIKITYDTKEEDENITKFVLKDLGEMEYKIVGESE